MQERYSVKRGRSGSLSVWLAQVLVLAAVYYGAGRLGQLLAIAPGNVTAVWPASGIALAALLLLGNRVWPGIWLGSFLNNTLFFAASPGTAPAASWMLPAAIIGAGAALEALAGASAVRRWAGGRLLLDRPASVLTFAALGAALSCLINATIGATILLMGGYIPRSAFGLTWLTRWLGDTAGVLVMAPVLLAWAGRPRVRAVPARIAEAILLALLLVAVGQIAFGPSYSLVYLFIPFLMWAALRFGVQGAATATLAASAVAVWGTVRGAGTLQGPAFHQSLLLLQAFVGVVAVTILGLSAALAEREAAERAARASEARKSAMLEAALDGIISFDHEGRIREFNPAAERCFGYRRDAVIGQEMAGLILPPSARACFRQGLARAVATELITPPQQDPLECGKRLQISALHADGSEFPVEVAIERISLDGPPLFTAYLRDISDRERAEEELQQSERHFRQLAENIREVFWMSDPRTWQVIYVSPAYEEIWGRTRESLYARPASYLDAVHPEDRERVRATLERQRRGEPTEAEYRVVRADRSVRWIWDRGSPIRARRERSTASPESRRTSLRARKQRRHYAIRSRCSRHRVRLLPMASWSSPPRGRSSPSTSASSRCGASPRRCWPLAPMKPPCRPWWRSWCSPRSSWTGWPPSTSTPRRRATRRSLSMMGGSSTATAPR